MNKKIEIVVKNSKENSPKLKRNYKFSLFIIFNTILIVLTLLIIALYLLINEQFLSAIFNKYSKISINSINSPSLLHQSTSLPL